MRSESIAIAGLPASGKTTFLAALWHVVTARDVPTTLTLGNLVDGDLAHLNAIAKRWRSACVQDRTPSSFRRVRMNLLDSSNAPLHIDFPDISGEAFVRMWEDRDCDPELVATLRSPAVALFVHSDTIVAPRWVVDETALADALELAPARAEPVEWEPRSSPTQVQLADVLQLLQTEPLGVGRRRLAIMLSAWDKAQGEQLSPERFLRSKLPLLHQYLAKSRDQWDWQVYGISAQGGEYDPTPPTQSTPAVSPAAEALRQMDCASERIRVVHEGGETHDLTSPLAWLMS